MQKPKLTQRIEILKEELDPFNSRIINKAGALHKSTTTVHKFEKDSQELKSIFQILTSKFEEQGIAMCTPVLRDSIVFYAKEDKIVGILDMCFTCWWIQNENGEDFEVDYKLFPLLKNKLIQIGHPIVE